MINNKNKAEGREKSREWQKLDQKKERKRAKKGVPQAKEKSNIFERR